MAAKRIGRSVKESTKVKGGSYRLPKAKNPHGLVKYGHQGSGFWGDAYHNQHYIRTGRYGNEKSAQKFASHSNKQLGGLAVGGAGLLTGNLPIAIGGTGYAVYQDIVSSKQLDKDTKTKPSFFGGFRNTSSSNGGLDTSFHSSKNMSGAHNF